MIEDDVYAELYFGKTRPRPVKAFNAAGLVMHCGSCATRPEGGYFLWVELPATVDALGLHELAVAEGISIALGPIFSAQRKY